MIEEVNFFSKEYAPTPPAWYKPWTWGCPKVPEDYVYCGGWLDRARCEKVINCPGLPAGLYRVEEITKLMGERKIKEMLGKGIIKPETARLMEKDIEEVYRRHTKRVSETSTTDRILKALTSPIGIAGIIGFTLILTILLMKK